MSKRTFEEANSTDQTNEYETSLKKLKESSPWMSYCDEDVYGRPPKTFIHRITKLHNDPTKPLGFQSVSKYFDDYGQAIPCACCNALCRKPPAKHILTEMDCAWKDLLITKIDVDTNENASINSVTKTPIPESMDWIDNDHKDYLIHRNKVSHNIACGVNTYSCSFLKGYQKEMKVIPQRTLNRYSSLFTTSGNVVDFADIACSLYEEHEMAYQGSIAIPIDAYHDSSSLAIVMLRENNCPESYKWFDKQFFPKVLYDYQYYNDCPSIFYKWVAYFHDKDAPYEEVSPTYCCCYGYMDGKTAQDDYKFLKYRNHSRIESKGKIAWDFDYRTNGAKFARNQLRIMYDSIKKIPAALERDFIYTPLEHSMKAYPFFRDIVLSPSYVINKIEHDLPGEKKTMTKDDQQAFTAICKLQDASAIGYAGSSGTLSHTTFYSLLDGFWGTHKVICSKCQESYGVTEATKLGVQTANYNIYWEIFKWLQLPMLKALDRPSFQDIKIITQ